MASPGPHQHQTWSQCPQLSPVSLSPTPVPPQYPSLCPSCHGAWGQCQHPRSRPGWRWRSLDSPPAASPRHVLLVAS